MWYSILQNTSETVMGFGIVLFYEQNKTDTFRSYTTPRLGILKKCIQICVCFLKLLNELIVTCTE